MLVIDFTCFITSSNLENLLSNVCIRDCMFASMPARTCVCVCGGGGGRLCTTIALPVQAYKCTSQGNPRSYIGWRQNVRSSHYSRAFSGRTTDREPHAVIHKHPKSRDHDRNAPYRHGNTSKHVHVMKTVLRVTASLASTCSVGIADRLTSCTCPCVQRGHWSSLSWGRRGR